MKTGEKEPKARLKYVKTDADACALLEISANTFSKWKKDPEFSGRFRIRQGKCGWPVAKLLAFQLHKKEKSLATVGGENRDLKREKLLEEIRGLKIKNDLAADLSISMDDHLEEVRVLGRLLVQGFAEYKEFALIETKNPTLVGKLERLEDRIRHELAERIENEA